jgi:hypothetical protein
MPTRIDEVGFTDDHELVIHWWCEECKRLVYASKSLADCWQECPKEEPDPRRAEAVQTLVEGFDAQFMQSIGIRIE